MRLRLSPFGTAARGFLALLFLGSLLVFAQASPAHAAVGTMREGVAAYFYPDVWNTPNDWYRMCDGMASQGVQSTAIMNPNTGPGASANSDYISAISHCHSDGELVVGYVHTSYGARSLTTVEAEIDDYYNWYGVDGIYLDEMSNDSTTVSYYSTLYAYIHSGHSGVKVIGGAGSTATTDWQLSTPVVDQLIDYEGNLTNYVDWTPASWVFSYPSSKFWNIVYNAPDVTSMQAARSHRNVVNADYLYVTPGNLPNPYGSLPDATYWPAEIAGDPSIPVLATIDPEFVFGVAGLNGSCNGLSNTIGGAATASSVPLGHISSVSQAFGAQTLSAATNAGNGFSVYLQSPNAPNSLQDGHGHYVPDTTGTHSSPATAFTTGTAGFAYTTDDSSIAFGSGKVAAVTLTGSSVLVAAAGVVNKSVCVGYLAGASAASTSGQYGVSIMYTAVPNF